MTITARRLDANRANAQRSTGPRTRAGKAAARLNAMRHGLYARETLAPGESDGELVRFGRRLRAQLAPVGELELLLADRIVSTAWRLRRLVGVESAIFANEERWHLVFSGYSGEKLLRLGRHEAGLERTLYRALHELQRLQATRAGVDVPVPAAVDVNVSWASADAGSTASRNDADALGSFRQNGRSEIKIIKRGSDHAASP